MSREPSTGQRPDKRSAVAGGGRRDTGDPAEAPGAGPDGAPAADVADVAAQDARPVASAPSGAADLESGRGPDSQPGGEPDGATPRAAEAGAADPEPGDAPDDDQDSAADDDQDSAADDDQEAGPGGDGPDDAVDAEDAEDAEEAGEASPALGSAPPDPADAARRRLLSALAPRATRGQLIAAAVCAVLGFSVIVQVQQAQVKSLASLRPSDLITVLDNVTQEGARLDDQAAALQQTLDRLRSATGNAPAVREAAQARLDTLGVLAGTLPATGPGIELDVSDPRSLVNATDLLETVQELRDAGAEAMQLGPVRVVARTALVDDPNGRGLLVDETIVSPPYKLLAIGDPQTLGAALEIPGGVLEVLRNKNAQGTVHTRDSLTITALLQQKPPQYAHPAASPGS